MFAKAIQETEKTAIEHIITDRNQIKNHQTQKHRRKAYTS